MKVLGLDPGATSGWCLYDTEARRVLACGAFESFYPYTDPKLVASAFTLGEHVLEAVVIERLVPHGATYPQVVEAAYCCGRLRERMTEHCDRVIELKRHDVRSRLQEATHGAVRVKNDATVWAALKLLHGDGCDKKGGALHGVRSHARAALAVAVAWTLQPAAKEAT